MSDTVRESFPYGADLPSLSVTIHDGPQGGTHWVIPRDLQRIFRYNRYGPPPTPDEMVWAATALCCLDELIRAPRAKREEVIRHLRAAIKNAPPPIHSRTEPSTEKE